ncbi:MAG: amidohydrolase family protein [Deltaproteobacteria bacterium]|jgi:imidazolonepropionase-like amidohydrolase|nr:amidohydrolase family protein [Deltaproteobacteria bacterium]
MKKKWFSTIIIMLALWVQPGLAARGHAEKVTAFVHVNLVPMTAERLLPDQTVLVKEAQIIAVGASGEVAIPENSVIIDGSNLYLMPGLADMHIHTDTTWLNGGWPVSPFNLFLANGVTTIRDFGPKGTPTGFALHWRNEVKSGRLNGPTIYAAGPILYGPADNAANIVRTQYQQGFDFVKLYSFLSQEEFQEAMATAKALNLYTAGHIPFAVGLDGVVAAGLNEIAHIEELDFEFLDFDRSRRLGRNEWFRYILKRATDQMERLPDLSEDDPNPDFQAHIEKIVRQLKASKIPLCTTLAVGDVVLKKLFEPEGLASATTSRYLPFGFIETLQQGKDGHQMIFRGYEDFAPYHYNLNQLLLRELHRGDVTLVLGTDAGPAGMGLVPGYSLHDELRFMVENGLAPYEALQLATVHAAEVINRMNRSGNFGTIEVGKKADLVLVDGNPLDDIHNTRKIQGVMASGRWFDKDALEKMLIPGIPVTAAVKHVYDQHQTHYTSFDIVIGKTSSGRLPGSIEAISIRGPAGKLPIQKDDFTYLPRLDAFWFKTPGKPQTGTYSIEVNSGDQKGSATVIQAVVKTIPLPDVNYFKPKSGATLQSEKPIFSWQRIKTEEPLYYRLEINRIGGGRVYSTGRVRNMQSHTVPGGVLKADRSYRWRIRITDGDHWTTVQNSTRCAWQTFHVR